jgi:hypothetical protein
MERFDVGAAVRDWTHFFLGSEPNLAYPVVWMEALAILHDLTSQLETKNTARGAPDDQITKDLTRWRTRLDWYELEAHGAPDQYDRQSIVWNVTAPLLLGWYGGPTGDANILPSGGFWSGFDAKIRHPADIATPYSLANQLGVYQDFEEWNRKQIRRDMQATIIQAAQGVGGAALNLLDAVTPDLPEPYGIPLWVWGIGIGLGLWWLAKPAMATAVVA